MHAFGTELGSNSQTFLKHSGFVPPYGTGNLLDENFHKTCCKTRCKTCCKTPTRTQKFLNDNTIIWPR